MGERPRGMQRALAVWVTWGMTATCFRRQQQHLTRFACSRILKVKIWLKCATIDTGLAGRREQSALDTAGKSARGENGLPDYANRPPGPTFVSMTLVAGPRAALQYWHDP
jgi:hypothetical protein